MAITFDTATVADGYGISTLTYSHTVGVGSDRIIISQPNIIDLIAGSVSISGVTYAAVDMGLVALSTLNYTLLAFYDVIDAIYGLAAPATGANNVVITASESCDVIFGGSQSWFGVRQSTPYGTAATNTGTNTTPTVDISSAPGEVVVAHASAVEAITPVFASADTERWEFSGGSDDVVANGASQVGAATVTMNWTGAQGGVREWGVTGVSLKPAPEWAKFSKAVPWKRGPP